jgi:AcrR family transcriptional regulator
MKSSRSYRKSKRAEDEQRTRARIVDAAEALHGTVGPARTTISAIAEHAGVTRATVYRHFPDDEAIFLACSAQWLSRQRLPDADAWRRHGQPLPRLRAGLADLYRYYREAEPMLTLVHRDVEAVPESVRSAGTETERLCVSTLLEPFSGRRRRKFQVAVAHAVSFDTWRSLCVTHGLSNRSAVDLMVGMVMTSHDAPEPVLAAPRPR